MTVGDKDVDPARTQPVLVIAYELYELEDPADLERIPMPNALRNPQIESRIAVKFAGYNGLLLNGRSDGGRRFSQYMALTDSKRVITMLVEATESQYDGLKPAVETIAKSVAIKLLFIPYLLSRTARASPRRRKVPPHAPSPWPRDLPFAHRRNRIRCRPCLFSAA